MAASYVVPDAHQSIPPVVTAPDKGKPSCITLNIMDSFDTRTDSKKTTLDDEATEDTKFCNGYGDWGYVINHNEHSILPDLKTFQFPEDIKNQADVIFNKMRYQVRRGKIRIQMLFYCVYCAHLELNRDVNPIHLGALFGLTQGEVQRCNSIFSPLQTGYKPPSVSISPLTYLPEYCQIMRLSGDAVDDILLMSRRIVDKSPALMEENPQTVAAGLLKYYIIINGITNEDPHIINTITGRSNVTIDTMVAKIANIDNA